MCGQNDTACWACWESENNIDNPLIRACTGCKSVDLQLIHHRCLQSYLANTAINQYQQHTGLYYPPTLTNIPALEQLFGYSSQHQMLFDHAVMTWLLSRRLFVRSESAEEVMSPGDEEPLVPEQFQHNVVNESEIASHLSIIQNQVHQYWSNGRLVRLHSVPGMSCARCLDGYNVYARPVSAFKAIRTDPFLSLLLLFTTICIIVVWVSSCILYFEAYSHWSAGKGNLVLDVPWFAMQLDVRIFSVSITSFFSSFYLYTLYNVMSMCRGHWQIAGVEK